MIQGFLERLADRLDIPGYPWKSIAIGLVVGDFCLESWLRYRQYKVLQRKEKPAPLAKEVAQSTFDESQAYSRDKSKYGFVTSTFQVVKTVAEFHFNVIPFLWSASGSIVKSWLSASLVGPVAQTFVFCGLNTVIGTITNMPFSYYHNFVLETKYGFNKMSISLWLKDTVKHLLVGLFVQNAMMTGLVKLIDITGPSFYYYAWVFAAVSFVAIITLRPILYDPLFNKFTPIDEKSELGRQLRALCKSEKVQFPVDKLLKVDGSARSSHGNAYFIGLPWRKQIVLYDTLIKDVLPKDDEETSGEKTNVSQERTDEVLGALDHELRNRELNKIPEGVLSKENEGKKGGETNVNQEQMDGVLGVPPKVNQERLDEVLGVLAHEIGHWKLNHIPKMLSAGLANIFFIFATFSAFIRNNSMYTSFGFPAGEMPTYIGLSLFSVLSSPISTVTGLLQNLLIRKGEYEADAYSSSLDPKLKEGLCRGLIRLSIDSLGSMNADWIYSMFNHSHPLLAERLGALNWVNTGEPVVSEADQAKMRAEKLKKEIKAE